MLCYRQNTNLDGAYVISRSVPRIVPWATAAHSFPRDTASLYVYDCAMSYTWLLYGLIWRMLLYHVTYGWSLIRKKCVDPLYADSIELTRIQSWWRHQMATFSASLALCRGNSPVAGEFPAQRPVTRSFNVFFDLHQIKRLNKHSRGWWFDTLSRPLWRHCNEFQDHSLRLRHMGVMAFQITASLILDIVMWMTHHHSRCKIDTMRNKQIRLQVLTMNHLKSRWFFQAASTWI